MAAPETRNEHITSAGASDGILSLTAQQTGGADGEETTLPIFVSSVIIICAFASFLVALVGFMTDHYAILVAGGIALAAVTFVWAIAAAIALWKICKGWFNSRRQTPVE